MGEKDITKEEEGTQTVEERIEKLEEEKVKLAEDKAGMEGQIIDLREKARLAKEEVESLNKKSVVEEKPETDPAVIASKIIRDERLKDSSRNMTEAEEKFFTENKEYHPENDVTGVKRDALKKSLRRLNTSESYSVNEHLSNLTAANKLISKPEKKEDNTDLLNKQASQNMSGGNSSTKKTPGGLTDEQEGLRKSMGWTKEKYMEMKEKYPATIV